MFVSSLFTSAWDGKFSVVESSLGRDPAMVRRDLRNGPQRANE